MATPQAIFHRKLRAYQIWGTHQGVGKTVASIITALSIATKGRAAKGAFYNIAFAKPVSMGAVPDHKKFTGFWMKYREGKAMPGWLDTSKMYHERTDAEGILRFWERKKVDGTFSDAQLLEFMRDYADLRSDFLPSDRGLPSAGSFVFFETHAGVDDRLPSRTPQADVYSSLQLPGLLVADSRPGGLENTIKAHKYLRTRGYDIQGAFVFKDPDGNHAEISKYFDENDVYCAALRSVPEKLEDERKSQNMMMDYYKAMGRSNNVSQLVKYLQKRHAELVKARDEGIETPEEVKLAAIALASAPAREEAARLEDKRYAELEAEHQAQLEAERQARLQAERQAQLEAERQARLQAERQAQLEAERQARLQAERQAQLDAERVARFKAQRVAKLTAQSWNSRDRKHQTMPQRGHAGEKDDAGRYKDRKERTGPPRGTPVARKGAAGHPGHKTPERSSTKRTQSFWQNPERDQGDGKRGGQGPASF